MTTPLPQPIESIPAAKIRHLLIDLGGVLLEINYAAMEAAFRALQTADSPDTDFVREIHSPLFTDLEIGAIPPVDFLQELQSRYALQGSEEDIADAWNALLGPLFEGRARALTRLKTRYDAALLSNTNRIHFEAYQSGCSVAFDTMDHLFLSHEMGIRKPGTEIFEVALKEMNWKADATLFIDDSEENTEAARSLGIHAYHLSEPVHFDPLVDYLLGPS